MTSPHVLWPAGRANKVCISRMHSVCETEQTHPLTRTCVTRFGLAGDYPLLRKKLSIPDVHRFSPARRGPKDKGERQPLPLCPLDSITPFLTRAAALDPGLGARSASSPVQRTLSGRGDDTARGLGEGSERFVVFLQKCCSERIPGPAVALRASSALRADGLRGGVARAAASLRAAGLRIGLGWRRSGSCAGDSWKTRARLARVFRILSLRNGKKSCIIFTKCEWRKRHEADCCGRSG